MQGHTPGYRGGITSARDCFLMFTGLKQKQGCWQAGGVLSCEQNILNSITNLHFLLILMQPDRGDLSGEERRLNNVEKVRNEKRSRETVYWGTHHRNVFTDLFCKYFLLLAMFAAYLSSVIEIFPLTLLPGISSLLQLQSDVKSNPI